MPLWNFNMGVNGKTAKLDIYWKGLIVGWTLGTRGPMNAICGVLFNSNSWSSVWNGKLYMWKLYEDTCTMAEYRLILFFVIDQVFKKVVALWNLIWWSMWTSWTVQHLEMVEPNGWKFWTRSYELHMYVLFISDSLKFGFGSFCALCKLFGFW